MKSLPETQNAVAPWLNIPQATHAGKLTLWQNVADMWPDFCTQQPPKNEGSLVGQKEFCRLRTPGARRFAPLLQNPSKRIHANGRRALISK